MRAPIHERETELVNDKDPQDQIDAINMLAWQLRDGDAKRAYELSEEAYHLSHQGVYDRDPYLKGKSQSLSLMGYLNHYQSNYDLALSQSFEALSIFERIGALTGIPTTLTIIGLTYLRLGNYEQSIPFHQKALKIAQELGDPLGEAKALNAIGLVYLWRDHHTEAISYFSESLQIYQDIKDTNGQCAVMTNLCMSFRGVSDYDKSLMYGHLCLQLCQKTQNRNREAMALSNIAVSYGALKNFEESVLYFNKALDIIGIIDDSFVKASVLFNTGKMYNKQGNLHASQEHLNQALHIAQESNQKGFQFECHQVLADTYKKQSKFDLALYHYEQFHSIRELVFQEESENKLKNLEHLHHTETARKEGEIDHLERQLRQSQKLEAIGTLAGGIAHEFNNILAAIIGFTELGLHTLPPKHQVYNYLQEVLKAGRRAKDLVQQILAFGRQAKIEFRPISFSALVEETLRLIRASLPSTIRIEQQIAAETGMVRADSTQLQQVVMNLCANAEYAMRGIGGVLEISVANVEVDDAFAALHPDFQPGPYVRLTIRDTGHGMTPEILEHIFDPFFTTKGVGEGSGMGLAMVHGTVTNHGGAITVESTPCVGTIFNIYLPRIAQYDKGREPTEAHPCEGQGRLLVVDDESAIAHAMTGLLKGYGYEVSTHIKSIEALDAFRVSPNAFDLVITDQTMPEMTGEQLVAALRQCRPDIPIILCTGFSHVINETKAAKLGIDAFVMKPVEGRQLATTIQQVLAQRSKPRYYSLEIAE